MGTFIDNRGFVPCVFPRSMSTAPVEGSDREKIFVGPDEFAVKLLNSLQRNALRRQQVTCLRKSVSICRAARQDRICENLNLNATFPSSSDGGKKADLLHRGYINPWRYYRQISFCVRKCLQHERIVIGGIPKDFDRRRIWRQIGTDLRFECEFILLTVK